MNGPTLVIPSLLRTAATALNPGLRRTQDFVATPTSNDLGAAEAGGHPLSERVGTLPRSSNEPKFATVQQMHRSLRDDPVDDGAARPDRRVANNVVEGHPSNRLIQVSQSDLCIRGAVRREVLTRECNGPFVDVREDDVTAFRQARGDDPECSVATAQIQDQLARSDLEGGEQEFRSAIDFLPRENARVGSECEGMATNGDVDLGWTALRLRVPRKVLFAHFDEDKRGVGLSAPLNFSVRRPGHLVEEDRRDPKVFARSDEVPLVEFILRAR